MVLGLVMKTVTSYQIQVTRGVVLPSLLLWFLVPVICKALPRRRHGKKEMEEIIPVLG